MNFPAAPPTAWTTGTTEVFRTGTWRAALPVYQSQPSPCHLACPVNGRIAEWIGQARAGDWRGAWTTLVDHNPFPAVAGRICHRPCESACNRGGYDAPLAICALERHAGELALAEGWRFAPPAIERTERIAVIGGGPSGLSAACQLRRLGYRVAVFEAAPELGGLMRSGIPPYRLPREVLHGEVGRILELGIEVRTGTELRAPGDFESLRDEFDAVYLATGARRPKRLPQLGGAKDWLLDGAAYLAQTNAGTPPALGRRLAVIGGGSAAMDVARSARRAGHEVSVLALEAEAQMPAQREEVVQAREEGVAIHGGVMLRSAGRGSHAVTLECVRVRFEPGVRRAEFRVTSLEGTEFRLDADAIVVAIGQDPELEPFSALETDGALIRTDAHGATSLPGVYAGGDVASTARFVTQAIAAGRNAAAAIDRWLKGEREPGITARSTVPLGAINTFYHPHAARPEGARPALDGRQALAEAGRCFSCGRCVFRDNCFHYCPDMAVRRVPGGYAVADEYCKGCGLCARECPTGSIAMQEELR